MNPTRPVILVLCDYYLPGYKAGGPIVALANLIELLGDDVLFRVVTRDRDLGDRTPYSSLMPGCWCPVGKAMVRYLSPQELRSSTLQKVLQETPHDTLYVNSFFSSEFSVRPMYWRKRGALPHKPIVLAPRGELSPASLRIKSYKKLPYLFLARRLELYDGLKWHATSEQESNDILTMTENRNRGGDLPFSSPYLLSDIGTPFDDRVSMYWEKKREGSLKIAFLSRVSRIKNLPLAISLLSDLPGKIEFNVFGPIEDNHVWENCQRLIKTLGPDIHVAYRGAIPHADVPQVMAAHHLFFLPTQSENFGHVISEALSAGCPVLISDQTPWRDLASHGTGWDLSLDNLDGFRQALVKCLGMGQQEHEKMRRHAQQFVQSRQSIDFRSGYLSLFSSWTSQHLSDPIAKLQRKAS